MRIYPTQIEQKLEVDQIRDLIKGYCQMPVSGALVMSTSPSVDYGEIRQRLMQTSDYIKITENDAGYPKGNLEDIKPLLIKIKLKGSYLGADDFFLLSKGNRILSQWQQFLSKNKESYTWLAQLAGDFEVDQALSDKIDEVIDDRGEVRDNASPALMKIRRDIVKSEQKVRKSIRTIFDQVKKDHFTDESGEITIREGRLVIPVKAEFKRKVAGFVHDESATGQTVFMEPTQVLELNNMVRELGYQEQREVLRVLTQLSDRVRINLSELEKGADLAIVVGGYNSSNTTHLVELCEEKYPTYFITGTDKLLNKSEIHHFDWKKKIEGLSKGYLPEKDKIEIILTSGASCPDSTVEEVLRTILGYYENTRSVEEVLSEVEKLYAE